DRGNNFVTYQLFCATFDIIVLDEHHRALEWTNLAQPDDNPWLFKFNVNLDMRTADQNYFNTLPASVQNKVKNLNPDSAFSVQQLYLDLNTAGLQDMPQIVGLDPSSEAYPILMRVFTDTYWANAKKHGEPILGYTIQPVTPNPLQPSIIPTDLNIEVSPNLDAQGNATTQYGLYTLNYLVMAQHHPMPAPVQFEWNWIESSETADEMGVVAINRGSFVDYLRGLVNQEVGTLSINTLVDLRHSGENFTVTYSYKEADTPATFIPVAMTPPGADGFTVVLAINYSRASHDDSENSAHSASIHGDFNYQLGGSVAFKGNVIKLELSAIAYIQFNHHEDGIRYGHLDGNYLALTKTVTYTLDVNDQGQLTATSADTLTDTSETLDWKKGGFRDLLGEFSGIKDCLNQINDKVGNSVRNVFKNYEDGLTKQITNSHSWVFPGGKTFSYKNVYFSDSQDLITHVVYVDPS
ncbi:MAG TPA: hypothetical protein VMS31_21965, partial [Pyrinomonadaceae bacterium]|nr:hypothetical protein [Pyrinomonadaceae bacterium]